MQDKPSTKDQWVRWGILVIGSLIVLAIVYGSGMRAQTARLRAVDEERKIAERDYRMAQRTLRMRLAAAQQLEARRQMSLALLELDNRNFGRAQERLKNVRDLLETAQSSGATVPNFSDLAAKLEEIQLVATPDTGAQRAQLLTLLSGMDAAFQEFVPSFLDESAKADAASPIKKPTLNDIPLPPAPGNDVTRVR